MCKSRRGRGFDLARRIKSDRLLGRTYAALANLEYEEGHIDQAIIFQQGALRYFYQRCQPNECAVSHHNLANYLEHKGTPASEVLAQRLAAAVIWYQTGDGKFQTVLHNLAECDLPPQAPNFAEVAAAAESLEGVHFRELIATRAPDGDASFAMIWERIQDQKQAKEDMKRRIEAALPQDLRAALETGHEAAFNQALSRLSVEQQATIYEQLMSAVPKELRDRMAQPQPGPDMAQVLEQFAPLLQDIADATLGDDAKRQAIEALLPQLEAKGWRLTAPVQALWSGERDPARLTADIDANSAQLLRRILALLAA